MNEELKPCPGMQDSKEDAIELWNTRPVVSMPSVAIDIALKAKKVMDLLEKHGPGIVQHLLDTDENAGQELRESIHALLTSGKVKEPKWPDKKELPNKIIYMYTEEYFLGYNCGIDACINAWQDAQKG